MNPYQNRSIYEMQAINARVEQGEGCCEGSSQGNWIEGICFRIHALNATEEESRAVQEGLNWAWGKGWRRIVNMTTWKQRLSGLKEKNRPMA